MRASHQKQNSLTGSQIKNYSHTARKDSQSQRAQNIQRNSLKNIKKVSVRH